MKKKINTRMCGIAFLAVALTAILVTASFYRVMTDRAWTHLEDFSKVFTNQQNHLDSLKDMSDAIKDHYRVTLIEEDGKVSFDSKVDISHMENHADREEVKSALRNGTAKAVRKSSTIGKNTYYYAQNIGQNRILRVSADADSITTTFISVIPLVAGVGFCAFILCFLLSHHLTKGLLQPIEDMAEGKIDIPYEELQPFARTIKERQDTERMKQEFTANVSHELKTPLTSISGYAELIESGMAKEKDIPKFAGKIHTEAKRLIVLIGDIMQLSELEEPGSFCEFKPIMLQALIEECIDSLEIPAKRKQAVLTFQGGNEMLLGDRKLIAELIYNLCDNAIRYNKIGGSVTIMLDRKVDGLLLSVEDTGIGIAEKNFENVFRRFYRVDKSRSKETGGTGLGLAIVKHIAELHGAEIFIESKQHIGTNISILFPYTQDGK